MTLDIPKPKKGIGPRAAFWTCDGCAALVVETWREPSGDGETYDNGRYNKCKLKANKIIDGAYGSTPVRTPYWCPAHFPGKNLLREETTQ